MAVVEATEPPDRPTPKMIAAHSGLEFLLTFALLFAVTTITRWVMGPSPIADVIPQIHLRLLLIGACVGPLLAGLILSPPGKISGAHTNPAISLAMWRLGVFPGVSVVPYIVVQLAGSMLGVLAARAVWGPVIGDPSVAYAVLRPGPGWSAPALFAAEAVSMGVIVCLVGTFLRKPRLAPLVPWLVGFLVGVAIASLGTTTGGSINPAREFGPAVISGQLDFLWVYLLAPMVGAAVAATIFLPAFYFVTGEGLPRVRRQSG
ncbi:MIP/aquaporin family protein [Planotetraspora thailandica]|uniref:MIP/aquaporin family protein n=1 Tax=Planotetraspora thailandica TaxID=487172 RepID=UPI0019510FAA|nr:aquaporin [Planotetraspora thailandica]